MKSRLGIFTLALLFATAAYAVPYLHPARTATQHTAGITAIPLIPSRDNPDDDSIYYHEGFEDGWNGWTSHDLTYVPAGDPMWHTTNTHSLDGHSWWCGNEDSAGYRDHWLKYLDSPAMDLRGLQNLRLSFMAYWSCEDPSISPPDTTQAAERGYNGWDGCNVWISTDNGAHWQVIQPTQPAYMRTSLFSFGYEFDMGRNIPGWVASSGDAQWPQGQWVNAVFDLSHYNNASQVKVRWAFCSDPAWHTGENPDNNGQAWGFLVDSLRVAAGNQVVWHNEGDAAGDMELVAAESHASGDYWELTQDDAHAGSFSARCPVQAKLNDALQSPALDIPRGYYTHFDFWFRPDQLNWAPDTGTALQDFFVVDVSRDSLNWDQVVWEYDRDSTWHTDWHYFGPDSSFNDINDPTRPAWKSKLNLTGFAGQRIWLRICAKTNDDMEGDQGAGLFIDDFRLMITEAPEFDAKVNWAQIGYPTAVNFMNRCKVNISNVGLTDIQTVHMWYDVNGGEPYVIQPWQGLNYNATAEYNFTLDTSRVLYADSVTIRTFLNSDQDSLHRNDTAFNPGVVIYPSALKALGYDNRSYSLGSIFRTGHGAAIKFTPFNDGVRNSFDIKALRVRWNGLQQSDAQTRLHIYRDSQGHPGNELYNTEVTVTRDDVLPNLQVIDLSAANALQRLTATFWVWFEMEQDSFPMIIGDVPRFGAGHYFDYHGGTLDTARAEWQVQAILMGGGISPRDALLAGRNVMDFDTVLAGHNKTMRVAMFNGGVNEVTVSAAHSDNNLFQVQAFEPTTLRIGDLMEVYVTFQGSNDPESAWLTFESTDQTPPHVVLLANGSADAVRNDDLSPIEFSLGHAYPNPFNSTTMIPFTLAVQSNVRLAVYDLSGRLVRELVNGLVKAGRHNISFDAANLATGVYLYRMETGSFKAIQKLVVVK